MPIDSSDTAWILVAIALVMLMTLGVGLFYAGMVRRKNAIAMVALSLVCLVIVSVQWVIYGYSLAFGRDFAGFLGDLSYIVLNNVGLSPIKDDTTFTILIYQMMFAVITLAILTSAVAERVRLSSFIVFGILWMTPS